MTLVLFPFWKNLSSRFRVALGSSGRVVGLFLLGVGSGSCLVELEIFNLII